MSARAVDQFKTRDGRRRAALVAVVLGCTMAVAPVSASAVVERDRGAARGAMSGAAGDPVVASDAGIHHLFALAGTVLYSPDPFFAVTDAPWLRVVSGRRLAVAGLPPRGEVTGIGRDRRGRVVATVESDVIMNGRRWSSRWWAYDVARDVSRRLPLPVPARCVADAVTVWGSRTAYFQVCPGGAFPRQTLIVRDGGRTRRIRDDWLYSSARLVLRGRSLAVLMVTEGDNLLIERVLDRGRRCVTPVGSWGEGDPSFFVAQGASIGASGLEWAQANGDPSSAFTDLVIKTVALSGACAKRPLARFLPAPQLPMLTFAIDGRWLYYATPTALHRHRLPATASAAPPANDNFENATPLDSALPIHAVGRIGHATRQRREPRFRLPSGEAARRSVWYAFRPAQTGWVELTAGGAACTAFLFTGSRLRDLTPVRGKPLRDSGGTQLLAVNAARTYRLALVGGRQPTLEPCGTDITAAGPPPANDDFAHATPLTGPLPIHVVGSIGYATSSDANEPQVALRTVWYALRPSQAGRVELTFRCNTCQAHLFTRPPAADFQAAVPELGDAPVPQGAPLSFDVIANTTYFIDVAAHDVTHEQFTIDITTPAASSRRVSPGEPD